MLNAAFMRTQTTAGAQVRHEAKAGRAMVIVPNLHWRYSGVTATNRMIAPRLAAMCDLVWLGRDAPDGVRRIGLRDLFALRGRARRPLIWHARRNNEMIVGLLLRALGWPLRLVFTSAAQRRHSWITHALVARMDAVIATSEAAAGFLHRPATVIPHGIDTTLYAPPADRTAEFAASGLPGRIGIGCFGRVRPQKGTDVFVDAVCRVLPAHPGACAVIIGATTLDQHGYLSALKAQLAAAGLSDRVLFLGELPIAEVPRWYRRISLYAFTSRNEGFGLTLLEAMAAGTAVVAARAGAAETVIADGDTGLLVPPGDVDALAAALDRLLRDPAAAAAMGDRARRRVCTAFSLEAEAGAIAAVYREALGMPCR
jgi:mannosyltransferase